MKNIKEVYSEIQKLLVENGCHIIGRYNVEDDEDKPTLIQVANKTIKEIEF